MSADLVVYGTVLTVDEDRPTAECVAVRDGRIVAVGARADVEQLIGPDTELVDYGDGCVMPGFVEAHGHPLMEAIVLSDRIVDIRPVVMRDPDDVLAAIRNEVAARGASGAYLNGWDPLLQTGGQERSDSGEVNQLPAPTLEWLDGLAPDTPLVIIHNSGHLAYFNSAIARQLGLGRDTPDPKGAKYGRAADGELDGTAEETGAVFPLIGGAIDPSGYPALLLAECARLNRAGLTTCSEMAFDPMFRPVLDALRGDLTVRLRTYEMSTPQMTTEQTPANGDDVVRQVGIKIWVDGSPWVGNIDLSFPYLDTEATRTIGVTPGSCGHANYTREQLSEIVGAYFPLGWQLACHVQGDAGVDTILDVYEEALRANPRQDHRLRLEHVGAISDAQLKRAHELGVTCSIFVDQIHYLGRRARRRAVRPRARLAVDARRFGRRDRNADLAAQRSAGHAGGAVAQRQRGRHAHRAERTRARARGTVDGRPSHPGADHRRGVAAAIRGRDRFVAGRQVRRHGGVVGRPAGSASGDHRRPGGTRDLSRRSSRLREFRLKAAADVARSLHV